MKNIKKKRDFDYFIIKFAPKKRFYFSIFLKILKDQKYVC